VGGLGGAWLVGTGVVAWREVRGSGHMPVPGALLGVTLLFAGLGLFAEIVPASARAVGLLGWGLDLAGLLNILPAGLFGQVQKAGESQAAAEGRTPAGGTGTAPGTTTAGGRGTGA
jgi:hypothetical protein